MGSLLIFDGTPRVVPLASTTLVGRGTACHARLDHPRVPTHWLEIRWLGEVWAWRTLAGEDATRGPSTFLASGWRSLGSAGRFPRVSIGDAAWVELLDASAPAPFAWDLTRDEVVPDEVLGRHLEVTRGGFLPLAAEGIGGARLADGDILAVHDLERGPMALRVHMPTEASATLDAILDVTAPDLAVELDVAGLTATFHQGQGAVTVRGECVRVLALYVHARGENLPPGGWMTPGEAWEAWVALGGNPASTLDRLSWERGKLRSQLARLRVASVSALFQVSREGDTIRTRLGVDLRVL